MEVIRIAMNNHRPSNNLIHRKPICFHRQVCISSACQQRRQVTCVFRVCLTCWIIMASCSRKINSGAAFTLVDMESIESCFTFWQVRNLRHNSHASVLLVKSNASGYLRYFHATTNFRRRIWTFFCNSALDHLVSDYADHRPLLSRFLR